MTVIKVETYITVETSHEKEWDAYMWADLHVNGLVAELKQVDWPGRSEGILYAFKRHWKKIAEIHGIEFKENK